MSSSPSPFAVRPVLRTSAVCCALFAGTVLLFSRGADYDFSNYDDTLYVTQNLLVQAGLTWSGIVQAFAAPADYWHPLTWISHMLDWELYGPSAYGHHLTSILWHAANAVLAFLLFRRLTGAYWTAAFGAALFAWHPLRVESVVWITERKDVMSGFFFLATLWAYSAYAARRSPPSTSPAITRPAWPLYALTFLLFLAGLMSKPMLVTLPVVLLVLDFWPLHRLSPQGSLWHRWRGLLLEKLPFFALSAVASVVTILMQRHKGAFVLELPLDARLANAVVSISRYLGKFFWPVDLTVCYPHPGYWPWFVVAAAAALAIAVTVLAWRQRRRRPWILTGWLSFLIMLLPAIGIIQVGFQSMADRYTYISILGWQLAFLWTLRAFALRPALRVTFAAAGALVLAACSARNWDQQSTWRDPATLFRHAIAVTERNDTAHALLGFTLFTLHQFDEAEPHALRALELNPRNTTALFVLAGTREHQQRLDEAIAGFRAILAINPDDAEASYRSGLLLLRTGRIEEAIEPMTRAVRAHPEFRNANLEHALAETRHGDPRNALTYYRVALAAHPDDPEAHFGAGFTLNTLGRTDEAFDHFTAALAARPDYPEVLTELGLIHLARDQLPEAAARLRAALALAPDFIIARIALGRAAEKLGHAAEATSSFEAALRQEPDNPLAHRAWADILARRRQFREAIRHYERAADLDATDAESRAALGFLLIVSDRREEGLTRWEEALRLNPNFPGLRQRLEQLR